LFDVLSTLHITNAWKTAYTVITIQNCVPVQPKVVKSTHKQINATKKHILHILSFIEIWLLKKKSKININSKYI